MPADSFKLRGLGPGMNLIGWLQGLVNSLPTPSLMVFFCPSSVTCLKDEEIQRKRAIMLLLLLRDAPCHDLSPERVAGILG